MNAAYIYIYIYTVYIYIYIYIKKDGERDGKIARWIDNLDRILWC